MDFSGILDVAIGMAFIFLLFSLVCSALVEMIESLSRKRGKMLWNGLIELFMGNKELVEQLYQQPFIYALFEGKVDEKSPMLPSYIPERNFVLAFVSLVLQDNAPTVENFKKSLSSSMLPPELQKPLLMMAHLSADNWNHFVGSLEKFYLSTTERLSGKYKRHTHWVSFWCALVIACAANLDALVLANSLMTDQELRGTLVKSAESYLNSDLSKNNGYKPANTPDVDAQTLNSLAKTACTSEPQATTSTAECRYYASLLQIEKLGLPIGWQTSNPKTALPAFTFEGILNKLIGLLLTAVGVSLGAPFWFDILNKFINVRSTVKSLGAAKISNPDNKVAAPNTALPLS